MHKVSMVRSNFVFYLMVKLLENGNNPEYLNSKVDLVWLGTHTSMDYREKGDLIPI